jgi:hypothetical protein
MSMSCNRDRPMCGSSQCLARVDHLHSGGSALLVAMAAHRKTKQTVLQVAHSLCKEMATSQRTKHHRGAVCAPAERAPAGQ